MIIGEEVYEQWGEKLTHKKWSVALVRPTSLYSAKTYSAPIVPPVGLAYLAGVLEKANYKVQIVDALSMDLENYRYSECGRFQIQGADHERLFSAMDKNTDIIGVTAMYSQEWPHIKRFIKQLRGQFPQAKIVMGGEHAAALPVYSLNDCSELDYIICGEGEFPLLELVHSLRNNLSIENIPGLVFRRNSKVLINASDRRVKNLEIIPWPAWHLLDMKAYFKPNFTMGVSKGRNIPMVATRGCPYRCTFCSNVNMWTTQYYMRSPQDVVDEIQFYIKTYNINSVDFTDLTAIVKKEWVIEFSKELNKRQVNIVWQLPSGTRSEALDEDVVKTIKEAGNSYLVYAPESGSKKILKQIQKRVHLGQMLKSIKLAKKHGHTVKANFIIGFPDEKRWDVFKTLIFMWRLAFLKVDDVDLALFTPYPGSPLFKELQETGEIEELNDKYFEDLVVLYDLTFTKPFARYMSSIELLFYRVFGLSVYYTVSYLMKPLRAFKMIKLLVTGPKNFVPENLFEQRVFDAYMRQS